MAWFDQLIAQGYTVPGAKQNNFSPVVDSLAEALGSFAGMKKQKAKDAAEKQKNEIDMYKTLRDSGYDPSSAYKAVREGKITGPGGETPKEKESAAKVKDLAATTTIKEKQATMLTESQKGLTQRILNKIAEGTELTKGEQKVYDEVIRKYGNKSALEEALGLGSPDGSGSDSSAPVEQWVPMLDPQGNPKKVHVEDVQTAIKQGWKKR